MAVSSGRGRSRASVRELVTVVEVAPDPFNLARGSVSLSSDKPGPNDPQRCLRCEGVLWGTWAKFVSPDGVYSVAVCEGCRGLWQKGVLGKRREAK